MSSSDATIGSMSLLRPFSGFVPSAEHAHRVVGPPSSMLTNEQQAVLRDDELSFRHRVGRGAKAPQAEATNWLQHCIETGALQPVTMSVIVHRIVRDDFSATGLLADVSIDAYDAGRVKRHEATITKSQAKMATYMGSTRIFGNPVALAHRSNGELSDALQRYTQEPATVRFIAIDGASHELWVVGGVAAEQLCSYAEHSLYITDGHHRLAAASLLAKREGRADAFLPAAVFLEGELRVQSYARMFTDEAVSPHKLLSWLEQRFQLQQVEQRVPRPQRRHQLGVRLAGSSYLLAIPAELIPRDIYGRLDVNLLDEQILSPFAGVTDPRTDSRMSFVADTRRTSHDVDGCTAWFLPYPPLVGDVMAVADAGQTMPPKSTFFLPKVPSGLIVRPVDPGHRLSQELP